MTATTLSRLQRDIDRLTILIQPPAQRLTALAMADNVGLVLDSWQRDLLESQARQLMLNVTRQGGKSTIAALLAIHRAITMSDSLVLVVSPGERQSKLLFKKVMRFYRALNKPVPSIVENQLSLELANGSAVHALPGKEETIRGFSAVDLLLIDEAARVADELMAAVRPMLAVSDGRLVTMSTPWGKRGWWYAAWSDGGEDWERYEVAVTACPRISPAFIEQERRTLPPAWFASEYLCQFVEPENALFSYESIAAAFNSNVVPLFGGPEESHVA
jgi:hypothetical protein